MMPAEALDSTAPYRIRGMRRGDVPAVAALERAVYPQPWSVRVFFDELAQRNRTYLVAEDTCAAVVGYAGLLFVDPDAHVTTVAVEPGSRRHRLGTRLMLALVDEALARGARNLTLEVRMSNQGAQRLYQRFGFAPVGLRKNYYRDEDALVMWAIDIDGDEYGDRIASIRSCLEDT
jgi:ribosomal-protein-alanine N-acetyltransferase